MKKLFGHGPAEDDDYEFCEVGMSNDNADCSDYLWAIEDGGDHIGFV